jgi:hypothetical protein
VRPQPTELTGAEEDRRERRLKLGLPAELSEAELAEERRREKEKADAEAARKLPVKPVETSEKMRQALVALKKAHAGQDEGVRACLATLLKIVGNVAGAPGEQRFRAVRLSNPAVAQRVGAFTGAVDFLELVGFRRGEGEAGAQVLELAGEPDVMVLRAAGENLSSALNNPFFGVL